MVVYNMRLMATLVSICAVVGCVDAARHTQELHSTREREMTVGIVQREIRNGMTQDEVAAALGSPNIVSRDRSGQETWIYDKIATEASYSKSSGGVGGAAGLGGVAGAVLMLGMGGGSYDKAAGASAVTQKTLTVIIKYGSSGRVTSATYHSSTF